MDSINDASWEIGMMSCVSQESPVVLLCYADFFCVCVFGREREGSFCVCMSFLHI